MFSGRADGFAPRMNWLALSDDKQKRSEIPADEAKPTPIAQFKSLGSNFKPGSTRLGVENVKL